MLSRSAQAQNAAYILSHGGLVVFPTDTVLGVAAALNQPGAIARLYALKERPREQATAVLISSIDQVQLMTDAPLSTDASRILLNWWPGPLTVILPRQGESRFAESLDLICGEKKKIGMRLPDHGLTLQIIDKLGAPLVATSANYRGKNAPESFQELDKQFASEVDFVIENGQGSGVASTVIDLSTTPYTLLRQGAITTDDLSHSRQSRKQPMTFSPDNS